MTSFNEVPIEMAVRILSELSIEDLINARIVCSGWFEIIKLYKLIKKIFNKNQISKYLDTICFKYDLLEEFQEQIYFDDIKRLSKIYLENKKIDGMVFLTKVYGHCDEEHLRQLLINNEIEIPDHFKKIYPDTFKMYQMKNNGILDSDMLWYVSFRTALEHSKEEAIQWLQSDHIGYNTFSLEDAQLLIDSGLWDECKDIIVSDDVILPEDNEYYHVMINLGIEYVTKYILEHLPNNKFIIRYPNQNAINLCGSRIKSCSIRYAAENGRIDLAELIISKEPFYYLALLRWYLSYDKIDEAINYLKTIDRNIINFHDIHIMFTKFGNMRTLLKIFDIFGENFPFCSQCPNQKCYLDICDTNFNIEDVEQFIKLGGRTFIFGHEFDQKCSLELIIHFPIARELADWITVDSLDTINWDSLMKPEIKWMIERFGLDAINQKIKEKNIDFVKTCLLIGDIETAVWIMQSGLSYDKNIPELPIQIYDGKMNIDEIKQLISIFCAHLETSPKLQIDNDYYLTKKMISKLKKWYVEKYGQSKRKTTKHQSRRRRKFICTVIE